MKFSVCYSGKLDSYLHYVVPVNSKYNPDGSPDDSDTQLFFSNKENRKRHKILVFLISMFYFYF